MDLGTYGTYPLPAVIRTAFGAATAQELADGLGVTGTLTPERARDAESAYNAYRAGDSEPAQALLVSFGLSEADATAVLGKLPNV